MRTTTTVRLSDSERELLAELSEEYGSRTGAIREGIRLLAQQGQRRRALREFLDEWAADAGPPDPDEVEAMRRRYYAQRPGDPDGSPRSTERGRGPNGP